MSGRAPTRAPLALPRTLMLAVALAAAAAPAHAKVTLQGTTTATAGWTDNVLDAPDEQVPNGPTRDADFFFQLAPGAVLTSISPRLLQRLAYTFTADLFVHHSEANSYSNSLEWAGDVALSKTLNLLLTTQTLQGRLSTFNLNQASSGATIGVLPQNTSINFFSQAVTESLDSLLSGGKWRMQEVALFRAFIPTDRGVQPDVYEAQGDLSFDRVFRLDSLGALARVNVIDYQAPRDPMTDVPIGFNEQQVLTTLLARWRRDWSPFWSTEAALGVINGVGASSDPTAKTQTSWSPSALAALRFTRDVAAGELRYAHDVAPNPLFGSTFETDQVGLQAGCPSSARTCTSAPPSPTSTRARCRWWRASRRRRPCRARRRHHRLAAAARGRRVRALLALRSVRLAAAQRRRGHPARHHAQHRARRHQRDLPGGAGGAGADTRGNARRSLGSTGLSRDARAAAAVTMMEETMKRLMLAVLDRRRGPRARVRPAAEADAD